MSLRSCSDPSAAAWITSSKRPWHQLVTFGPSGFDAYARLRFLPDPRYDGQPERLLDEARPLSTTYSGRPWRCCDSTPQHRTTSTSVYGTVGVLAVSQPPCWTVQESTSQTAPTSCCAAPYRTSRTGTQQGSPRVISDSTWLIPRSSGQPTTLGASPTTWTPTLPASDQRPTRSPILSPTPGWTSS